MASMDTSVFAGMPVSAFPAPSSVITIDSTATLAEALDVLAQANILAAPVRNVAAGEGATWKERYTGVLSVDSIVYATLAHAEASKAGAAAAAGGDLRRGLAHKAFFATTKVGAYVQRATEDAPFYALDTAADGTLLDVMYLLGHSGQRRVFVVDHTIGAVVNVITQSGLVSVLATMEGLPAGPAGRSVGDAVGLREVFSVTMDESAQTAFTMMRDRGINAVPIVAEAGGALVSVVSVKDIRIAASGSMFGVLKSTMRAFLNAVSEHRGSDIMPASVSCPPTVSVRAVIDTLVATKLHRVIVVDEDTRVPVSVCSLKDVIAAFVGEPGESYTHKYT